MTIEREAITTFLHFSYRIVFGLSQRKEQPSRSRMLFKLAAKLILQCGFVTQTQIAALNVVLTLLHRPVFTLQRMIY